MRPTSPADFESIISKPRLNSYRAYFHTTSIEESIGLYMWNTEISSCFASLLAHFEIALRNNIHSAMSSTYPSGSSFTSNHWYDRIQNSLKKGARAKIDEVRHTGYGNNKRAITPPPNPDEIVSRVSFGFWPNVLGIIDTRAGFADKIFPKIFPHHRLSINPLDWTDAALRQQALAPIYELNQFRNRVAHHEPLWKFSAINNTSSRQTVMVMRASTNLSDSLIRFTRLISMFDEILYALNPSFKMDLASSSWRQKLNYLLSDRGLERYRREKHYPAQKSITPTKFRRNFSCVVKYNQPVNITLSQKRGGIFIPD
jgi:hypothetical protein